MNYTGHLFMVVLAFAKPATLFGWADKNKMLQQYATDSREQHSSDLELSLIF